MTAPVVLPLLIVPLLNTSRPLAPDDTALPLRIVTPPDDDDAPRPLTMYTSPPVRVAVVDPATTPM
jgi:hypothetical protein